MKILIIAPYYAPSSEVPSVRMISLSSYLVKNNHNVTVLCWSKEKLLTLYKENELSSSVPDGVKVIEFNSKNKRLPFMDDLRFGKELKKLLPQIISKESYDIVFATCGPYFSLEAMPQLNKKYNIPYVLDFRDLGVLNYRPKLGTESNKKKVSFWKKLPLNWYNKKISERERKAVEGANGIIFVSQIDKEKMQKEYKIEEKRCVIASNGFDDAKLSTVIPKKKQKGIVGAVFGKFMYYSKNRATAILKGIDLQRKKGIDIRLMHIGRHFDYIDEAMRENDLDSNVYESCGLKEYSVGMALLGSADFFVVEDTSPDDVGTKIYDYIYWNKPIIAAVPKGIPLAKLVRTFEHGYVCETEQEINDAIDEIVRYKYSTLDDALDNKKYSRTFQNYKMEELLKNVTQRR